MANVRAGEQEALGDGVGVFEQDLAFAGGLRSPGWRSNSLGLSDLALQRRALIGERWPGRRELAGGPREERWCATARKLSTRLVYSG